MVSSLVLVVALATLALAYSPYEQYDLDVETPYGPYGPYGSPYTTGPMGGYGSPSLTGYGYGTPYTTGYGSPYTTGYGYGSHFGGINNRYTTPYNVWNPLNQYQRSSLGGLGFNPRTQSPLLKSMLRGGRQGIYSPWTKSTVGGMYGGVNPMSGIIGGGLPNLFGGIEGLSPLSQFGGINQLNQWGSKFGGISPFGGEIKEVNVCPEVDGGINLISCIADSHAEGFQCLKQIEEQPRYQMCLAKPSIKKALKDWHVTALTWHKELLKCTTVGSTGLGVDPIMQDPTIDVPIVDVPEMDPIGGGIYDEFTLGFSPRVTPFSPFVNTPFVNMPGQGTSQCIRHIRGSINQCTVQALQCPTFMQCHETMPIKQLQNKTIILQNRFVRMVEKCVQGTLGF